MAQKKILIVVSNYYKEVSDFLIEGATKHLKNYGFEISILYSPGCFEIPFLINIKGDKYETHTSISLGHGGTIWSDL